MATEIAPNSVGWYILEGFPWWPVYICDVSKLRPTLHLLGNGHKKILKKARDFPLDFIVVYYFGSHDFSLVSLKKGVLKPWDCAEKDTFLKGQPRHLAKKKGVMEELLESIQEAEEYLSQPEDIRLPQHMVPSDLDPTLEPPPPELVPQEMDQEMEDEEMEQQDAEEEPTEEDGEHDDVDVEREKKKKKEKQAAKEKKKLAKEKKKTSKDKKDKKHKKSKSKDKEEHLSDDKKRRARDSAENAEVGTASPVKVAKSSTETDVKSEPASVKAEVVEKKPPPENLSSEALSIMLEKEIRWILVNCQFEEMTTKTVRKLLEDRLHMDLRHHKPSIKEGVARVIASMEEEDSVEPPSTAIEESAPTTTESVVPTDEPAEISVKVEENEAVAVTPDAPVVKQEEEDEAEKAAKEQATAEKERMQKQLEAAAKDLALDLESNIVNALASLKSLDTVDKDVLAESGLVTKLVKLRAHRKSNISEIVSVLVKKWDVEDLVPAPKPITQKEILDMKAKLESSETSHEEVLTCLNLLGEMPLTIPQMKKTGIARVVSKLRQHGNDKVSAKAHELRQMWIKLMNSESATSNDANAARLKTLRSLNRILEQRDGEIDYNKQMAALEQLHNMQLQTQDIIETKVGVSVSKLRKSSNENVSKLAKKLRKKWQAQANPV